MLRTPRARLSAIKFLVRHIPKDIQIAANMVDQGKIYKSQYNLVVKNGTMLVEEYGKDVDVVLRDDMIVVKDKRRWSDVKDDAMQNDYQYQGWFVSTTAVCDVNIAYM